MAADASAYDVLGLEPGADPAAIEQAYKRLIKQHHPDRAGGDARTAADITRAYRELRAAAGSRHDLVLDHEAEEAGSRWSRVALVLAAGVIAATAAAGPVADYLRPHEAGLAAMPPGFSRPAHSDADIMDRPISTNAVAAAVNDAQRLNRTSDQMGMAKASADCHRDLRAQPSLAGLDRCAAFDDAIVQLQDRDPLRDNGPFSELAVTGRSMSAASALSNDYLAIDGRLDRIRVEVELALAPAPLPPVPATANPD